MAEDPVFKRGRGWYFWNETWSDAHGPYKTEEQARKRLEDYCEDLLAEANDSEMQAAAEMRQVKDYRKQIGV